MQCIRHVQFLHTLEYINTREDLYTRFGLKWVTKITGPIGSLGG